MLIYCWWFIVWMKNRKVYWLSLPAEYESNIRFQIIFISYLKIFSCIKTSVTKLTYHALYVQTQFQINSKLRMLHIFIERGNHFASSRPNCRGNASLGAKKNRFTLVLTIASRWSVGYSFPSPIYSQLLTKTVKFLSIKRFEWKHLDKRT